MNIISSPIPINSGNRPQFKVLDKNKKTTKTLIHCFIAVMVIDTDSILDTITASNGAVYDAIYDNFIVDNSLTAQKVIVSFQKHTHGKYAVIRNFKEKVEK